MEVSPRKADRLPRVERQRRDTDGDVPGGEDEERETEPQKRRGPHTAAGDAVRRSLRDVEEADERKRQRRLLQEGGKAAQEALDALQKSGR